MPEYLATPAPTNRLAALQEEGDPALPLLADSWLNN
jgi:hypothetical protein